MISTHTNSSLSLDVFCLASSAFSSLSLSLANIQFGPFSRFIFYKQYKVNFLSLLFFTGMNGVVRVSLLLSVKVPSHRTLLIHTLPMINKY